MEINRMDFHEKLLHLLVGEVLKLKLEIAQLKGGDETVTTTVAFLKDFLMLFPEEARPDLHAQLMAQLQSRETGD